MIRRAELSVKFVLILTIYVFCAAISPFLEGREQPLVVTKQTL